MIDAILDLYRRTFPAPERRSDEAIATSITSPNYRLLIEEIDAKLVGFSLLYTPADESFALLEYLAVEPASQGHGVGASLVSRSFGAVPDRHVMVEVEDASLGETARRRQRFYRRCGCSRIEGVRYRLPLPGNPPPMELMIYPSKKIETATLRQWLRRIYRDVYQQSADDPRIDDMLSSIQ